MELPSLLTSFGICGLATLFGLRYLCLVCKLGQAIFVVLLCTPIKVAGDPNPESEQASELYLRLQRFWRLLR